MHLGVLASSAVLLKLQLEQSETCFCCRCSQHSDREMFPNANWVDVAEHGLLRFTNIEENVSSGGVEQMQTVRVRYSARESQKFELLNL